ncbi:MAG: glycosyltransferase family 4 protein, partial [Chloroflexi bacterium]|nr:glycosyltransferase family 4 protein [Chloroflexota bacterium]
AILACWRSGTPILVRGDSHLRKAGPTWKAAFKEVVYRVFVPRLDGCLAVGSWSRDYFLHYGARPERVFRVPHTADETHFELERQRWQGRRAELRERWGLPVDSPVFAFVGKFTQIKRPMDFLCAINRARAGGTNLAGLMVGDGPLRTELESFIREAAAPVRFAGFLNQSEIAQAYVACDALVLASEGETWGLVVNEAMLCHRPCVVSDRVGCGPDLVLPGQTGDVFPMGDVESLARLLTRYASQPGELAAMGGRARERARICSIGAAVEGVREALAAVTSEARRPLPLFTGQER